MTTTSHDYLQNPSRYYMCFPMKRDALLKSFECGTSLEHHGVYSLDPSRKGVLPWSSQHIDWNLSIRADAADTIERSFWHTVLPLVCMDTHGAYFSLPLFLQQNLLTNPAGMRRMRKAKKNWTIWSRHVKIRISSYPLFAFWYSRFVVLVHTW